MKRRVATILLCGIAPVLAGCLSTTRYVKVVGAPSMVRTSTLEELVAKVDKQFSEIQNFRAKVVLTASVAGETAGEVKDYTALNGYILMRKPEDLRVILMAPLLGTRAMDMASDGTKFTLLMMVPTKPTRVLTGTDVVAAPSKNPLENLRPGIFFDALLVRSIGPDEFVTLTESSRLVEPETKHHDAISEPDYDVSVMKLKQGKMLQRLRTIHFSRVNLQPYQQDIYDANGRIMTTVQYSKYQMFGDFSFPTEIAIDRPIDRYSVKVTVQTLTPNGEMPDDQFQMEIPHGVAVETLK